MDRSFYCQHLVRQHNIIYFVVCNQTNCKHCTNVNADSRGVKYLKKMGGRLFQPAPSPTNPNHFRTFIESDAKFRNHPEDIPSLDSDQPSMADVNLGTCESGGCRGYKFLSKANEARHLRRVECLNVSAGNHHFHFHLA